MDAFLDDCRVTVCREYLSEVWLIVIGNHPLCDAVTIPNLRDFSHFAGIIHSVERIFARPICSGGELVHEFMQVFRQILLELLDTCIVLLVSLGVGVSDESVPVGGDIRQIKIGFCVGYVHDVLLGRFRPE